MRYLQSTDLLPGDVLLCFTPDLKGKAPGLDAGYAHAAISLGTDQILEAAAAGVRKTTTDHLLNEYDHIAVMRGFELWDPDRIVLLRNFADEQLGKSFNSVGALKCTKRKEELAANAHERVLAYFANGDTPSPERGVYFCSELVTSAFIRVGIVDKSAAVLFAPESFSPEDIGRDKAFGFFIGYIVPSESYEVPADDVFRHSV